MSFPGSSIFKEHRFKKKERRRNQEEKNKRNEMKAEDRNEILRAPLQKMFFFFDDIAFFFDTPIFDVQFDERAPGYI